MIKLFTGEGVKNVQKLSTRFMAGPFYPNSQNVFFHQESALIILRPITQWKSYDYSNSPKEFEKGHQTYNQQRKHFRLIHLIFPKFMYFVSIRFKTHHTHEIAGVG